MSSGCTPVAATLTGSATNASENTETRAGAAIYVSLGASRSTFSTYAEKYAYLRGKANCTTTNLPCAGNQMLG